MNLPDPSADLDGDGTPNYADPEFPYCGGFTGEVCTNFDADGDGKPNHIDLDADNDGIPDIIEAGGADTDGNGMVDATADIDSDGLPDWYDNRLTDGPTGTSPCSIAPGCLYVNAGSKLFDTDANGVIDNFRDADGDMIPNHLDHDSDNDGVSDAAETSGLDVNGDGFQDSYNSEFKYFTGTGDYNGNGMFDTNDGGCRDQNLNISGSAQSVMETSGTVNNPDYAVDLLTSAAEIRGNPSGGSSGAYITVQLAHVVPPGYNISITHQKSGTGNGSASGEVFLSSDGITFTSAGTFTTNSHNGGTSARGTFIVPANNTFYVRVVRTNTNNNRWLGIGFISYSFVRISNPCFTTVGVPFVVNTSTDLNGFPTAFSVGLDRDQDRVLGPYDLDSDGDGVADVSETGGVDNNTDGFVDFYNPVTRTFSGAGDGDRDGFANSAEADGNNDGVMDNTPQFRTGPDTDNDQRPNSYPFSNTDQLSLPNLWDLDSDNDGITDAVESRGGVWGGLAYADSPPSLAGVIDGIAGFGVLVDANRNGWLDAAEGVAITDTDGDGIPDYRDLDTDNDGIPDFIEAVCTSCLSTSPGGIMATGTDANNNGILDQYENLTNANLAGGTNRGVRPNEAPADGSNPGDYMDTDTDNDGAYDWTEGFDVNGNGYAKDDFIGLFGATYEAALGNPGIYIASTPTNDPEGDWVPDWLDNSPGSGYIEAQRPPFMTVGNAFYRDLNQNGLIDMFEAALGGMASPLPNNGGTDADWRDNTIIAPLPVEMLSFEAKWQNDAAKLEWTTTNEINNSHFEVEHATALEGPYNTIGLVQAVDPQPQGVVNSYEMLDLNAQQVNYYRLRQVDFNGGFRYSQVVELHRGLNGNGAVSFVMWPNPAKDVLNIKLTGIEGTYALKVWDVQGRMITMMDNLNPDESVQLIITDWASGIYAVEALGQNGTRTISNLIVK